MGRVLLAAAVFLTVGLPLHAQQAVPDAQKADAQQVDTSQAAAAVAGAPTPDAIVHVGRTVKPPRLIHQVDPAYSDEARREKINGSVEVYLVVDEQGLPQRVKVVRGLGHGLDESAVNAIRQYRFAPATQNGVPVKVDLYIDVNFQIFKHGWGW